MLSRSQQYLVAVKNINKQERSGPSGESWDQQKWSVVWGTWSAKEDGDNWIHLAEKTEDVWNNNNPSNRLEKEKRKMYRGRIHQFPTTEDTRIQKIELRDFFHPEDKLNYVQRDLPNLFLTIIDSTSCWSILTTRKYFHVSSLHPSCII